MTSTVRTSQVPAVDPAHTPMNTPGGSVREELRRIPAVDSLRIVCALIVFGSHLYALPVYAVLAHLTSRLPQLQAFDGAVVVVNRALFDGAAAVCVFFVISGICIHWPVRAQPLSVGPYLVRRFVRVGLPLLVSLIVAQAVFGTTDFLDAVLWSLYCELIYYAIYPLLRVLAARVGWTFLVIASFAAALMLAAQPDAGQGYFFAYGHAKTWILGLPIWLTGVWIAQFVSFTGAALRKTTLNFLRFGVWLAAALILTSQNLHAVPFKFSLLLLAPLAGFWVLYEIRNGYHHGTWAALESAGTWSFSVYLCHKFAIALFARFGLTVWHPLNWLLAVALGIALSLLFYRCVEWQSHRLARWLASRTPRMTSIAATPKGLVQEPQERNFAAETAVGDASRKSR